MLIPPPLPPGGNRLFWFLTPPVRRGSSPMTFRWFASLFTNNTSRSSSNRCTPMAEVLEDRTLPSATTVLTSLQDASLRSLAQTDYTKDGSLSRNDMIGIFREVAQDGQVTTKELSDLQNLVSHGMTDLGMALYVKDLSNDVVNYNLANKHFQGQTLLSTGQLAAGPYAAQLNTLVDKWFLGKDLPLANTDAST